MHFRWNNDTSPEAGFKLLLQDDESHFTMRMALMRAFLEHLAIPHSVSGQNGVTTIKVDKLTSEQRSKIELAALHVYDMDFRPLYLRL